MASSSPSINRTWAVVTVALVLSLGIGVGLHYGFILGGLMEYVWIPSLMCIVGAHAPMAIIVLDAFSPTIDRRRLPRIFVQFALFILAANYLYATAYISAGILDTRLGAVSTNLLDAYYFSVITWATVGYGDFVPNGPLARVLAAIEALDAYFVMAMFISCLVPSLMTEARHYERRQRALLRRYLAIKGRKE